MNLPNNLFYTKSHEWIRFENGTAWIGVTDYAQESMGDVVFVEFKNIGLSLNAGDPIALIESVKSVFDIYTPVDGEIIQNNIDLEDHPEWINEAPYDHYIVCIKLKDPSNQSNLLSAQAYEKYLDEEA